MRDQQVAVALADGVTATGAAGGDRGREIPGIVKENRA